MREWRPRKQERPIVPPLRTFLVLLSLLGCSSVDLAYANDNGYSIEEVVVSVTRRKTEARDLSTAVSAVNSEAMLRQSLVTDSLAVVPGVFLQQTTPGQATAIVRGLKGSSVLHVVDGMRLNNAIMRSAPTQYLALVPPVAVDRIEVLRGTPTSLYGSDAIGGVIQLVTKTPRYGSTETQTSGDVFLAFDSADLSKILRTNVDIGNRYLATSFSFDYLATGDRRVGGGNRVGPSDYESKAGRIALSVNPGQKSTWLLDLHYLTQPETPRFDELTAGFGQTEPSSIEYEFSPNTRVFVHVRHDRSHGNFDWRFDLSWQRIDDDRITREFFSNSRVLEKNRSDLFGAMLTVSGETQRGSWTTGFEYYFDNVHSNREVEDIAFGDRRQMVPRFPDDSSISSGAAFFYSDIRLTHRHALNGGIRISSVSVDLPATPNFDKKKIDNTDFSGNLGWRLDLATSWQIVANISYGFRTPNVFDMGTFGNRPGNRFNIPNTALDSERVLQADIGARFGGERFDWELFVYTLEYRDRIISVSTGSSTPGGREIVQSSNAGRSNIHGAEFEALIALSDKLSLHSSVTYIRGEQSIDEESEPADRIPPLNARLTFRYQPDGPLSLAAWLTFARHQNRLSARDATDVRIDPNGTDGWATAGLKAMLHTARGWKFELGVDNVFDRRYRHHGSGIDAPGRGVSLTARRTW